MNKLLLNRMKFIKSFFIQQFALLISVIYIVVGFFGRFYCCSGGSHFIQLTFHNNFTIIYQYNKTNKLPSIGKLWQLTHYATYYNTCTGCICNSPRHNCFSILNRKDSTEHYNLWSYHRHLRSSKWKISSRYLNINTL